MLLKTIHLLSRLYGKGLQLDELKQLESSLEEQLKYVKVVRDNLERSNNAESC